ncbi:hypothetical protein BABINDRAFT_7375 [Babjeviella inositovora NRRL Y-12698]|uniref:Complex III subunit 9 n=1 Tax=Babjeviella inositovora NRRL Y-12698 TaxID=984486 RepID=A0A1E3QSI1_9ASCO|nr:uncharacterized protein BABINDRAFT_7375 [Babjeviella inositovora NRRL Y-12698]ODQ80666.1 hypothetical protein BABINDRAFT_7375 [Babjeviella inositovora NRRL Y-12698]
MTQSSFTTIYNTFFKRNSVYVASIFAGAFVFQGFFDVACTNWYEAHNKGKLWKDIKHNLIPEEEEDDE